MENFFVVFESMAFWVSALMLCVVLAKKFLWKKISIEGQYIISYLYFVIMALPFVPLRNFENSVLSTASEKGLKTEFAGNGIEAGQGIENLFQNFTVSVDKAGEMKVAYIFLAIWLLGAAVVLAWKMFGFCKLSDIKNNSKPISCEMENVMTKCMKKLKIKREVASGWCDINSPMMFGFINPFIALPAKRHDKIKENEIEYIFCHELSHYKNNDILINYIICVFEVIYWFNPIVWLAFKNMRFEREIICDRKVLSILPEERHTEYGMTIINFAKNSSVPSFSFAADMGGKRKDIFKRIEAIAGYSKASMCCWIKSTAAFFAMLSLILFQAPNISAIAARNNSYEMKSDVSKMVVEEDLSSYFNGYDAAFVLYDSSAETYTIYNKEKSEERVSPNSTYKIYSALFALDKGIINKENSKMKWDGTEHQFEQWNMDHDIYSAMSSSANWYFENLTELTGFDNVKNYFCDIGYGNCDFSAGQYDFWSESSLKISPMEQVVLLKEMMDYDMDFPHECVDVVKDSMLIEQNGKEVLYGKTGTGNINGNDTSGWFVGCVESGEKRYVFAANLKAENNANGSAAAKAVLEILNDKCIYEL